VQSAAEYRSRFAAATADDPVKSEPSPSSELEAPVEIEDGKRETSGKPLHCDRDFVIGIIEEAVNLSAADPRAAGEKLQPILELLMRRGRGCLRELLLDPMTPPVEPAEPAASATPTRLLDHTDCGGVPAFAKR
jgi:hypothetical protein